MGVLDLVPTPLVLFNFDTWHIFIFTKLQSGKNDLVVESIIFKWFRFNDMTLF